MTTRHDTKGEDGATARVSTHRHSDSVALSILHAPGTVYMSPKAARALAREIMATAREIARARVYESGRTCGTSVRAFPVAGLAPALARPRAPESGQ